MQLNVLYSSGMEKNKHKMHCRGKNILESKSKHSRYFLLRKYK